MERVEWGKRSRQPPVRRTGLSADARRATTSRMSERTHRDSAWLAELTARAVCWAEREERRWGKPEPRGFAASLAWGSVWAATRFARLASSAHAHLLVDELPGRARARAGPAVGPTHTPEIPKRIALSEPDPATLSRAVSTLLAHDGIELLIAPGAARMWRHFEPVLGPRLAARGVSVRIQSGEAEDTNVSAPGVSSGGVLSLDGLVERSELGVDDFGGPTVDVVIAPYLHDRRDLRRLGDHLVSELAAPAPGVRGVRLFVAKSWLQRAAFREHVEARFMELRRSRETHDGGALELRWLDALDGAPRRYEVVERALDASNTAELFDAALSCAERGQTSLIAASAYVAPFLLEREAAAKSFERWRTLHPARVVVLNQRASHAFELGSVPWSDGKYVLPALGASAGGSDGTAANTSSGQLSIDAPFLSPIENTRMLGARVRFERSPTSRSAVWLRLVDGVSRF
jgi:hypothetical protein